MAISNNDDKSFSKVQSESQDNENNQKRIIIKNVAIILAAIVSLAALYVLSRFNYLLFHSMVEVFSIVIAFAIFVIAWNSRRIMDSNYLAFIGIAFLFVAGLNLLHTLAYKGMEVFPLVDANLATQLWIATRYVLSFSFLIPLLFVRRKIGSATVFIGYSIASILIVVSIFYWKNFPQAFIDGVGLTAFKVASEYAISLILLVAIALLVRNRMEFSSSVFKLLLAGMATAIVTELAFTLYTDVYGIANVVGHLLNVVSFYFIYRALVETSLTKPYELLFRNLKQSEVNLANHAADLTSLNSRLEAEIIERKKAEYDLQETRNYLENLLNYANAPVIVWNPESKITLFNHAFEHMTGFHADDVLGKRLELLFPENKKEEAMAHIKSALEGEFWQSVEIPILDADGTVKTVLWNSANIYDVSGEHIMATIAQGQDITQHKEDEEALISSEKKYRTLFETSQDGIMARDFNGRMIDCNQAYAKMVDYSKKELMALPIEELLPERWREQRDRIFKEILEKGGSVVFEREYQKKDGSIFPASVRSWRLTDESGKIIGVWSIVRDITQQKELQTKLQQYATNLERLVEERTMQLKDAERMAAIGTTAGMVGHDIRNPLQAITSDVFLLKSDLSAMPEGEEKENVKESLEGIEKNVDYIDKIVHDLQDFARPLLPIAKEIDIEILFDDVLVKKAIPENIEASREVEAGAKKLVADPDLLRRILANLVNNAVQAMPKGGKLTLRVHREKSDAVITVQDTGVGIPEEVKPKIFTPLFTTKSKGQGFGLAVVKRMTEALGGTVTFESETGIGTKFNIRLPLKRIKR